MLSPSNFEQSESVVHTLIGTGDLHGVKLESLIPALKAVADPLRAQIIKILRRDSYGVLELCRIFGIQQPAMSHHLKVMAKAGVIESRREGNSIYYKRCQMGSRTPQVVLGKIYAMVDMLTVDKKLISKCEEIQSERKKTSEQFYELNAGKFSEQQDLIASSKDYGSAIELYIDTEPTKHWLEVGPGSGELLMAKADDFQQVLAIDISAEMLEICRKKLTSTNVKLLHSGVADLLGEQHQFDCITCSMVLHHVASPQQLIADMQKLLKPSGQLIICDLDQHEQDWAYESCGDIWLGFTPEQLNQWASDAELTENRSHYLALKNGFRVQIREYKKQ